MGHTTASMTLRVREERSRFSGFKRALLLKSDQLLFDELWDTIEAYVPAAEKSSHPFLIATVLMAMLLEQRKLTAALQCQLEKLQHEGKAVQQSQENEFVKVKAGVRKLDEDVEARLRTLREEIMELLYSGDATA